MSRDGAARAGMTGTGRLLSLKFRHPLRTIYISYDHRKKNLNSISCIELLQNTDGIIRDRACIGVYKHTLRLLNGRNIILELKYLLFDVRNAWTFWFNY